MAHEAMSNDKEELEKIAACLKRRIQDQEARLEALRAELALVEKKLREMG